MMVGLMQFIYRLLNPIEENNPRMYHFDIAYGQLIGMLLLTLICYQFTIVGEGVVRWESLSLPVGQHEIQLFLEQMGSPREFWNMGRFAWVIGKVIFMACIIIVYAVAQQRKFYVRTVTTGILHIMSFAQLVVALITFTAGIMLILTSVPLILQAIIGFCMIVLCVLSTVLLLQTMGRIVGACINGTPYEGLILMLIALFVAHVFEWIYMLTR